MEGRFNRENVLAEIASRIRMIQDEYDFDPMNGSAQVVGEPTAVQVAYGEYYALRKLYYELT